MVDVQGEAPPFSDRVAVGVGYNIMEFNGNTAACGSLPRSERRPQGAPDPEPDPILGQICPVNEAMTDLPGVGLTAALEEGLAHMPNQAMRAVNAVYAMPTIRCRAV
jgi:hypothetical protein